ncbi:hypothetical protein OHB06_51395 [Streptomyces sp. NBC_01604]|uniref:hypothetical protein n=1 Tax=Streptomyces sp. NBC_01604 TaxID=2975894 RepID=UPI00386D74F9
MRIEQTRRRLAKLRSHDGLVDRVTLPQAGRTRVWVPTQYGVQVAGEWPELGGGGRPRPWPIRPPCGCGSATG